MLNVCLINAKWCFDQLLSIPYLMISKRNVLVDRFELFQIENQIKIHDLNTCNIFQTQFNI